MTPKTLSDQGVIILAIASAIVTANAYYIHPIVGPVSSDFAVSAALVGAVPALNQIALALGVLLLLPLGDRLNNRRLIIVCLSAQVLALLIMARAQSFGLFVAGSTLLGFFTITPYLLPAYASKRVDPARLGFVTAVLTTGVVAGVQLSRLGSGVIAQYLGWRAVYWIAAALMLASAVLLPRFLDRDTHNQSEPHSPYGMLLLSLAKLFLQYRTVMVSGLIQGMNFAIFLATWLGIGLYLTSEPIGLGTDIVGYLAACSAFGLLTTPILGKWADRVGAEFARVCMALMQLIAVLTLSLALRHWSLLLIPIVITSICSPLIDITGRMISLRQPAAVRTRLMSLYITMMFLGGGFGSWTGTAAYDAGGWYGTVILTVSLAVCGCILSLITWRRSGHSRQRKSLR